MRPDAPFLSHASVLPCCSQIIAGAQSGQLPAAQAVQAVRSLFEDVVSTSWLGGKRGQAQAASDLLDEANALLAEFDSSAVAAPAPAPPPPPPVPEPAAPKLPAETFFLSADKIRDCLTLNIDSSILVRQQAAAAQREAGARRGGWPLGKKRKVDGGSQSAGSGTLLGWLSGRLSFL
jgi:hypothetical protein